MKRTIPPNRRRGSPRCNTGVLALWCSVSPADPSAVHPATPGKVSARVMPTDTNSPQCPCRSVPAWASLRASETSCQSWYAAGAETRTENPGNFQNSGPGGHSKPLRGRDMKVSGKLAGWRNGRRTGLKILYPVRGVRVRVPPRLLLQAVLSAGRVQKGTSGPFCFQLQATP